VRVLVAGCGYVGSRLAELLVDEGHEAWGLRRSDAPLPEGVHPIRADLLDPELPGLLPRVDHAVFAASSDASTEEAYRSVYLRGLDALLAALRETNPDLERFVFVSSTAVYGDAGGGWVDEATPPAPKSFRGSVMVEAEELSHAAAPASARTIALRLGGIYGPGRDRLLRTVREGRARCPGDGPIWSNRIHRDDAAAALLHLLRLPDPAPLYLGVDPEPTPLCEVYRTLARLLEAPEPPVVADLSRDRSNKRCSSRLLRDSGFAFSYPSFREGYEAMIRDLTS
jgi:nucleoside-diphosphate-sugar epimerase